MRTFIALDFDDNLKKKLFNIQSILKANSKKGFWVYKSNFHMTLKFLGEIHYNQIEDIDELLKNISYNSSPILLSLDRLGYFNNRNNQYGVFWVGLNGEVDKLNKIYDIIEKRTENIGFIREKRKFKPHITLGRKINTNKSFDELEELIAEELKYSFCLDNLVLMKSEEIMRKRVYTPIKSYKLAKDNDHR